ncbi:solute carrier family 12 member 2-like [Centruroides vittatus]|uniref:solute carrier family 12 member 2-like n=1 Tax=Centruroides vittatus TaxID=120091 RepID=UPI00350F10F0
MSKQEQISFHPQITYELQTTDPTCFQKVTPSYDNFLMKDELTPDNRSKRDSIFGSETFINAPYYTYEASPCDANYRNSLSFGKNLGRPTLDELHNPAEKDQLSKIGKVITNGKKDNKQSSSGAVRFGWVRGVFLRCILNIWGVMLFLRMGWMTGQAGIGLSIAIVGLATVVTLITTMSMSAICTNGEVKGGGAYYLISRSLGPEFGGAVGVIFSFANSIAVAMYIVGAAETISDILKVYNVGIVSVPSGLNDMRISGIGILFLITGVTGIGMAFENKAQILLLILLLVAMFDYLVGACFTPRPDQIVKGFTGWQWRNGRDNFGPDFRGENFFSVFAIFFPSVIGILAGANISGDLKNPSSALPKGTFLAIITTSFSYVVIILWLGFTLIRDATGNIDDLPNEEYRNCKHRVCTQGMMNYNQVMEMSAAYGPLIYIGTFSATLSSALAAMISAPRLFQALCKDEIFPYLKLFSKGYGPNNDPRRASALAFLIAAVFVSIGELNTIAPYISNFYMATYCLINFACFHASLVKSPGFRPGFKYYNKWISLFGAICCISVMFVMNWVTSLVTFAIVVALFLYIQKFKPPINWGSSTQGYYYKNALSAVLKLNKVDEHVKNFRPSILVLTGNAYSRPSLVDFANDLSKHVGLLICGHVIQDHISHSVRTLISEFNYKWLNERKVKAFYCHVEDEHISKGIFSLIQISGLGKLRPNTILMGFKSDWQSADPKEIQDYLQIIHHAFDMQLSVGILRVNEGLDYGKYFENVQQFLCGDEIAENLKNTESLSEGISNPEMVAKDDPDNISTSASIKITISNEEGSEVNLEEPKQNIEIPAEKMNFSEIPKEIMNKINQFRNKQDKGTIDVWWLYDDGGLTILMPYLLTTRSQWSDCTLRVFTVTHCDMNLDQEQVNMAALLKKFRIDVSAVTMLSDVTNPPSVESKNKFKSLISKWFVNENDSTDTCVITKSDLSAYKQKTYRYIRLRELLEKHSASATLIVMTLPILRRGGFPEPLYLAWLDFLTKDLPPVLLIRGNQTNVLTFYS